MGPSQVTTLRRADRKRGIDDLATEILQNLRIPQLRQPHLVEDAMGRQTIALLAMLDAACAGADDLEQAAAEEFRKHPDYAVITSFPGLAEVTGARILAEIGDDRDRFADGRGLKAYAGSAPVTRASGKVTSITHRRIKNDRLAPSAGYGPPTPPSTPVLPAGTTVGAATTAIATPPLCGTCSTR